MFQAIETHGAELSIEFVGTQHGYRVYFFNSPYAAPCFLYPDISPFPITHMPVCDGLSRRREGRGRGGGGGGRPRGPRGGGAVTTTEGAEGAPAVDGEPASGGGTGGRGRRRGGRGRGRGGRGRGRGDAAAAGDAAPAAAS